MKVVVFGLWHLGCVTAACVAKQANVAALDFDEERIAALRGGKAPVSEPGLDEALAAGLHSGRLTAGSDPQAACAGADVLWLCHDTPVNERDESDADSVLNDLRRALPHLRPGTLVLISAQLPVGTCRRLESEFPQFQFACSPENLRLGRAIEAFEKADRIIVGVRDAGVKPLLEKLLSPYTGRILFMRTESAEMVKHALNSFLALSITFINEIARLAEGAGADAGEVSAGLKSEARIGPRAYLKAGGPFAGGTLARDVVTLTRLAGAQNEPVTLIPAILESNLRHRSWAFDRLRGRLGSFSGQSVALLGLVYTPGTDTLRRSAAVELGLRLVEAGARVRAFDPAIKILPAELSSFSLATDLESAIDSADAIVVCTEWPEFREAAWSRLLAKSRRRLVVDPNGFLESTLGGVAEIEYIAVGRTG